MTYEEALAFWYGRINYEVRAASPGDLKLERMRALLRLLGDPHDRVRLVHVTGTKGKGSTCAMLASILRCAGYRVGLFTSPHLEHVEERIQVGGVPISRAELAARMAEVAPAVREVERHGAPGITFFEIGTALGFLHFCRTRCDLAVIEVGLGGRFDSTNVCHPLVSVITNVGFDHTAQLGNTLDAIAYQKAGIIKRGVPVVSGVMQTESREVVHQVASRMSAPLWEPLQQSSGSPPSVSQVFSVRLLGAHQFTNATVAVAAIERLQHLGMPIPETAIRQGLATVQWPARVEVASAIDERPVVILDSAHNVPSAEALVQTLRDTFPKLIGKKRVIFAVSSDKQYAEMLRVLAGYFDHFHLTKYGNNPRCVPPERLAAVLAEVAPGKPFTTHSTSAAAWAATRDAAGLEGLVCITGSVFLAGELRPPYLHDELLIWQLLLSSAKSQNNRQSRLIDSASRLRVFKSPAVMPPRGAASLRSGDSSLRASSLNGVEIMRKKARRFAGFPFTFQLLELERRDVPTYFGNQLFPLDNPWNQIIAAAPVASNSAAIINRIVARHNGTAPRLHADFGNPNDENLYGIPVNIATSSTPRVTVVIPSFGYPGESDQVQVPIPANAVIEGDYYNGPAPSDERGDSHLLVYDRDANALYELYQAVRPNETVYPYGGNHPTGQWGAWQISYWDLNTNHFRTVGDTSADAAGLPLTTGLVRPDEANPVSEGGVGVIDHAIRVSFQQTRNSFVFPASHFASSLTASDLPRMGERFRLKESFVIPTNWSPEAKAIAQAMKTYGLIVADNGSDMFFQGLPSTQWDMEEVLQIQAIPVTQFDVVDLTPIVTGLSVSTGSTAGGTSVTITGRNFSGAAGRLHVLFGTTQATSITIVSDTQIVATAPSHAAGAVDVRVQSGETTIDNEGDPVFFGYGTSANTSADNFTFTGGSPPPPPPPPPPSEKPFAVGSSSGTVATVTMYNPDRTVRFTAQPFGASYTGGVRVALGDVTGDGIVDVVAVTNGGTAARARIVDGNTGAVLPQQLLGGNSYTGAVSVALGDINADGVADIALGTNENGPHARTYRGGDFLKLSDFRAGVAANFLGRTGVALADMTGDGKAELVVSSLYSGGSRVAGYRGGSLAPGRKAVKAFTPFLLGGGYVDGLHLALGDVNADGIADLVLGSGFGTAAANVDVYSGQPLIDSNTRTRIANFTPAQSSSTTGVRVAVRDTDGDGQLDILTSSGEMVTGFKGGSTLPATGLPPELFAFDPDPNTNGGVWVG